METYMHIDRTDVVAEKTTQVQYVHSDLQVSAEVQEIAEKLKKDPGNTELWILKGKALAKQMLFREAVDAYSFGIAADPFNAMLYRHRGHRYVSLRRYPEAAADLETCVRLDPMNWSGWYHLGLAYYLMGMYPQAADAYRRCLEITKDGESLVAVVDWYWMTAKRMGDEKKAAELLELVDENTDAGEDLSYKKRILVYKGILTPDDLMKFDGAELPELEIATQGYGLSNYYYLNGDMEKSNMILKQVLSVKDFWSAFGFLAALKDAQDRGLAYESVPNMTEMR